MILINMKLLTLSETEGKFFWIQSQYIGRRKRRNIKFVQELVYAKLCPSGKPRIIEKNWPTISDDEKGVEAILKEWGYKICYHRQNDFQAGNNLIVRKKNPTIKKVSAPLLVVGVLTLEQRIAVGLDRNFSEKKYILDTEEIISGEVFDSAEIDETISVVHEARAEWENRKKLKFIQEFQLNSLDGGLSSIMDFGGLEKFRENDIPKHILTLQSFEMKDRRQKGNAARTYRHILLNTLTVERKIKNGDAVRITIPDQYKAAVIGKGGETIKISEAKLGRYILLH